VEPRENSNYLEMDGARKLCACLGCGKSQRLAGIALLGIGYIELYQEYRSIVEVVVGNDPLRVRAEKVANAPPSTSLNTESTSLSKYTLRKFREGQQWLELIEAVGGGRHYFDFQAFNLLQRFSTKESFLLFQEH
jgi:hypothetical protein